MALDEPNDTDAVQQVNGISFLVSSRHLELIGQSRDVRVDHFDEGFGKGFYVSTTISTGCG